MIIWYTVSFLTQTTLCYYDIKDALQVDPDHQEAKAMMVKMEKRAQDNKREAMQLNLMGKHREALQKISIAIDTDPIIADFHVLRYEVVLRKTTSSDTCPIVFSFGPDLASLIKNTKTHLPIFLLLNQKGWRFYLDWLI